MVENESRLSGASYELSGIALRALSHYEDLLRIIYESYAERFPDSASFWWGLAEEEASHAQAVKDLQVMFAQVKIEVSLDRFDEDCFLAAISVASNVLNQSTRDLNEKEALEAAMLLEETAIDQMLFETFDGDPDELASLFRRLREEYPEHRAKVQRRLAEVS